MPRVRNFLCVSRPRSRSGKRSQYLGDVPDSPVSLTSLFNLIALVVTLAAVCGWVNHKWFRLPHTIGLVVIALGVSFAALFLDAVAPSLGLERSTGKSRRDEHRTRSRLVNRDARW